MNATIATDRPTIEIPRVELALLRLKTVSPNTLCVMTGELLENEGAFKTLPDEVFTRLDEDQLLKVVKELTVLAEEILASTDEVSKQAANALRYGALGVTLMGSDGGQEFMKQHNQLLGMLTWSTEPSTAPR